jgi:hypothetical protein
VSRGGSLVKEIDEPSGPCHIRSQVLGSLAQSTVGRHQRHLIGSIGSDGNEGVVPAAGRMNNGYPVDHPRLDAAAGEAFEDDDNGFGEPPRCGRSANSPDEGAGCSWPIPPPAVRARPDHVCRIDEKHTPVSPTR